MLPGNLIPHNLLLYTMLCQLMVLTLMLLLLFVQTVKKDKRAKEKDRLKEFYIDALCRKLVDENAVLPQAKTVLEYDVLAEVSIEVLNSISGETADSIRQVLTEAGVVDHYVKNSRARSWMIRIYAIERLGLFSLNELKSLFMENLQKEGVYPVRTRLVWALSRIADEEALRLITQLLATGISISSKFNEYIFGNIITSCRAKGLNNTFVRYLGELVEMDTVPLSLKKDMIEACGSLELIEAGGTICNYFTLHRSRPEMRISCTRAAGRILTSSRSSQPAAPSSEELWQQVIIPGLCDEDWRVRAVAAGAAAVCPEHVIPRMIGLLHDENYHVRMNTGRSLAESGVTGLDALNGELGSADRFARDTVQYILKQWKDR